MSTLSSRFTLQLPEHWTPEQALAVYELLTNTQRARVPQLIANLPPPSIFTL